jgi:hypothetical protein
MGLLNGDFKYENVLYYGEEAVTTFAALLGSSSRRDVGPDEWLDALIERHNELEPEIKALFRFDVTGDGEPFIRTSTDV